MKGCAIVIPPAVDADIILKNEESTDVLAVPLVTLAFEVTFKVPKVVVPADAVRLPVIVPLEAVIAPEELDKAEEETVNGPKVPEVNVTTPEILAELEVKVPAGVT